MSAEPENAHLGPYVIERRLGAGSMGVVYQARHRARGVRVALKTLRYDDPEDLRRLKREFRALQDLQHHNLCSFGELFEDRGHWFFTMELLEGYDFLAYVRPGEGRRRRPTAPVCGVGGPEVAPSAAFDEARLRRALIGLAQGLQALHGARRVHRDVKPSNVRITREGRVVLCDFGLVTDLGAASRSDTGIVGTAAYMAPEQASSGHVGPSADWYSFGVLLYRALTGELPLDGAPVQILVAKQDYVPTPPAQQVPGVPPDLDALCCALLQADPGRRPTGEEILARLGAAPREETPGAQGTHSSDGALFVGRDDELTVLESAFDRSRAGEVISVHLRGPSGVGKTTLIDRFAERLRAEHPDVVVLGGRCYERESVPYKALDGVADELAQHMRGLPKERAAELVPRNAALLPRLFPSLGRVEVLARAPVPGQLRDPHELRAQSFRALRDLLALLTERVPLVMVIDDLQWADADSLRLMAELLRPPDAPPLLLIMVERVTGVRVTDDDDVLPWEALPVERIELELGALPAASALRLARRLARRANLARGIDPAAIAAEAGGHPLYIDELIRHAAVGQTSGHTPRLDEAIWARVTQLEEPARRVLELVAVAGVPLPRETLQVASELSALQFARATTLLRAGNLIRGAGTSGDLRVDTYHGRVAEAIQQHLNDATRRARHERLAIALELEPGSDPELLASQLVSSGARDRAAEAYLRAAREASGALAFDRAARLFRTALGHGFEASEERSDLLAELGDTLANAGRGLEAARAYQEASRGTTGARSLDLRCRWSSQLMHSGHIDEGLGAIEEVLGSVGLRLASTPRRALLHIVGHRARLAVRGLGSKPRDSTEIPESELRRVDVMIAVAEGLGFADTIRGYDFHGRSLLAALRAGEPRRVLRVLAAEATFASLRGNPGRRRTTRLLDQLDQHAAALGDPQSLAIAIGVRGMASFNWGDWGAALELSMQAEELFRNQCTGNRFELGATYFFQCMALALMGHIGELQARFPRLVAEAEERDDRFTLTNLSAAMTPYQAGALDDPDASLVRLEQLLRAWSPSGFHLPHSNALRARVTLELYRGEYDRARELLEGTWKELERSLLLRTQTLRVFMWQVRGSVAAACAGRNGDGRELKRGEHAARKMWREKVPYARTMATSLRAALAHAGGDDERAIELLATTEDMAPGAMLPLHGICARLLRGGLVGGDEGGALIASAEEEMRALGVDDPQRFVRVYMPAFD